MGSRSKQAARKFWETTPIIMKATMSQARLGEHNIAPVHFRILRTLAHSDCNLSELADRQGVSLPSISATAQTLVERGWLARHRSPEDRRVVNMAVTEEGRRVLKAEYERLLDWTAARLEPLSDEELRAVEQGMDALHRIFDLDMHAAHQHHAHEPVEAV